MSDPKEPSVKVVDRRWWARGDNDAAEAQPAGKPTVVEELEQRLAEATAQLQQLLTERRHAQQEFDESRARLRREVAKDVERGRRVVLLEMLDVLDNLDRAIASGRDATDRERREATQLVRGVTLVRDQFLAKLEQFGVTRMVALDNSFDTTMHEAVSQVAVSDPAKDGHVVAVVKEGYAIGDEVLRVASVVVGKS